MRQTTVEAIKLMRKLDAIGYRSGRSGDRDASPIIEIIESTDTAILEEVIRIVEGPEIPEYESSGFNDDIIIDRVITLWMNGDTVTKWGR